jgi:hypothetical protein
MTVLKQNNTLPDKPPLSTAPLSEQPSANIPSTGSSRLASLQRLPHHFLNSLRTKKSLAKKVLAVPLFAIVHCLVSFLFFHDETMIKELSIYITGCYGHKQVEV